MRDAQPRTTPMVLFRFRVGSHLLSSEGCVRRMGGVVVMKGWAMGLRDRLAGAAQCVATGDGKQDDPNQAVMLQ